MKYLNLLFVVFWCTWYFFPSKNWWLHVLPYQWDPNPNYYMIHIRVFFTLGMSSLFSLFIRKGSTSFTSVTTVYNVHRFWATWGSIINRDKFEFRFGPSPLTHISELTFRTWWYTNNILFTFIQWILNLWRSSLEIFKTSTVGQKTTPFFSLAGGIYCGKLKLRFWFIVL